LEGHKFDRDNYLDMDEASSYLGLKKSTLYLKVHKNEIGYIKIGARTYFTLNQLDKYLEGITKVVEVEDAESR